MSAAAVRTRALEHAYGSRRALDSVDLEVGAGQIFGLLGPNGGGKSTLFRILATLMVPTGGRAEVFGHDVVTAPWAVRHELGVAFQAPSLDAKLSVRENLLHQGHLYGIRGRALATRIDELLEVFGLSDRAKDAAGKLSGGLARRVDVAKALLHRPKLLLLDEPSTGLDPSARRDLQNVLARTRDADGTTSLFTTHIMEEGARCDRVAILDRGRLVAQGSPSELTREIGAEIVTLETDDPDGLADALGARFGETVREDGAVRLEREDGARVLPDLLAAAGGRVTASTVARPTLEDVFFRRTGKLYRSEEDADG